MMLRSSSTPILGSLLSSYSESPNHNHHSEFNSSKHLPKKLTFHHAQAGHLHLIPPSSSSFSSSPSVNADDSISNSSRSTGFRRAQSEGNLEGLLTDSCNSFDEFNHSVSARKFPRKPGCAVLQTIPSFSVYNPSRMGDKEEEEEEEEEEGESGEEYEEEMVNVQSAYHSEGLGMVFLNNMRMQDRNVVQEERDVFPSKMHLATGLGAVSGGYHGGSGGGGHNEYKRRDFGGENGDEASMEEYYRRMVEENPGKALFLRNYAQFLHQSEDLNGAEEYYSRAILVDPGDGEILSQYAQLTWELHGDEERTSSYFERAVQASPEDSHVLAAYAGFLWEREETEDDLCSIHPLLHENAIATAAT